MNIFYPEQAATLAVILKNHDEIRADLIANEPPSAIRDAIIMVMDRGAQEYRVGGNVDVAACLSQLAADMHHNFILLGDYDR